MTERARLLPLKIREHQPGGKDHCKAGDAHGKVDIILLFAAQHLTLSDDALREALVKLGYPIARRTVAKYREQLGIPVARMRKN